MNFAEFNLNNVTKHDSNQTIFFNEPKAVGYIKLRSPHFNLNLVLDKSDYDEKFRELCVQWIVHEVLEIES